MSAPPALANVLRPHGDFAIIGPGGGVDVLRAVANGSPSVTGIEINPIIANTIMRGRYADYSYHLYERPDVHIHVTDGRSFVRNAQQQFDVVQMTLVDTWASTAAGAFALSENSLYTVEAFREYFEHLKPDGMIAITRWEFRQPREALRVVSVAMEALHELGVANPAGNFIVVSEGHLDEDGIPVVVLAKKSAFTAEGPESSACAVIPILLQYNPSASGFGCHPLPARYRQSVFSQLILSNDPYGFARALSVQRRAGDRQCAVLLLHPEARPDVCSPRPLQHGIDWKVNLGVAVLGMVLIISLAGGAGVSGGSAGDRGRGASSRVRCACSISSRSGLGYILVEIAFIQRFVLFLGHPDLRADGGGVSAAAFERRGQPGFAPLARRRPTASWLPLLLHCGRAAALCFRSARPAGRAGRPAVRRQAAGQCRAAGPAGLRHGHAFPHWLAGAGQPAGAGVSCVADGQAERNTPWSGPGP